MGMEFDNKYLQIYNGKVMGSEWHMFKNTAYKFQMAFLVKFLSGITYSG